jgi:hypothetical protein
VAALPRPSRPHQRQHVHRRDSARGQESAARRATRSPARPASRCRRSRAR